MQLSLVCIGVSELVFAYICVYISKRSFATVSQGRACFSFSLLRRLFFSLSRSALFTVDLVSWVEKSVPYKSMRVVVYLVVENIYSLCRVILLRVLCSKRLMIDKNI